MKHNIILYQRKKDKRLPGQVLDAAIQGFKEIDVPITVLYEGNYHPSDIAIVFGYHKKVSKIGRIRKKIYDNQKENGDKVLVFERGFLDRENYHSVGWNGINGRADFKNKDSDSKRLNGFKFKEWKKDGKKIILCGQVPWDSNVQDLNTSKPKRNMSHCAGYLNWLKEMKHYLLAHTNKEIIFRPHPLFENRKWLDSYVGDLRWSTNSLEEDLNDAYAVVVYNSNSAVEAVMQGVPAFVGDKGSMVYSLGNTDIENINNPKYLNRTQWLKNISYSQWTMDEISKGLFWRHLNEG